MFVKNNNILFCLDGCLLGANEIGFEIAESCSLLYTKVESSLSVFLKRVITRWSCSCLVRLSCSVMFFSSG